MVRQEFGTFDPRVLAVRHPGWFVTGFLVIFFVFGTYGNWGVLSLRGGILDDALPKSNIYRQMDERVQTESEEFKPGPIIPIIIKVPQLTDEILRPVIVRTNELEELDDESGILSPANIPDYQDTGDALLTSPHLTPEKIEKLDVERLKRRLLADSSVLGSFVARNFGWFSTAKFLPPGYNEPQEGWKIVELLEDRKIPWWERITKKDIYPKNPNEGTSGWVMGRWQIDQGLNRDMMVLPALGMGISFVVFWFFLHSLRQALIAVFVNIIAAMWLTRACILPGNAITEIFTERVYTILAYANIIVQGISFSLHKFAAFRRASGETSQEKFLEAREVDGKIGFVGLIATSAFLSLWMFQVWQMREMGIQSSIGVVFALIGTIFFIPSSYLVIERFLGEESANARSFDPEKPWGLASRWLQKPWMPWVSLGVPIASFTLTCVLFTIGGIEAKTTPWRYIEGTLVERTFRFLEASGSGNEFLSIRVKSKDEDEEIYDPSFAQVVWKFQNDLTPRYGLPDQESRFGKWQKKKDLSPILQFKDVGSILGKVEQIARESLKKPFPTERVELEDIFDFQLASDLEPEVKKQLWYPKGLRLIASAVINDSVELRILIERTLRFAKEEYPNLDVVTFGKVPVYPQMDLYITRGEPPNIVTSFGFVFAFYLLWILVKNRDLRRKSSYRIQPVFGAFILILPFLFSLGTMGILMWASRIPLSMSSAPIADLAINAANDFGVYIAAAFMIGLSLGNEPKEAMTYALRTMGVVVSVDFLLNTLAFSPLWFSQFQPVREVGWMMTLMLISCAVGALVFIPVALPLAIRQVQPKEVRHDEPELYVIHAGGGARGGRGRLVSRFRLW